MELWGVRAGVWNNNRLQTPPTDSSTPPGRLAGGSGLSNLSRTADSSTPPGRPAGRSGLSNLSEKRPRATLDGVGSSKRKKSSFLGHFGTIPASGPWGVRGGLWGSGYSCTSQRLAAGRGSERFGESGAVCGGSASLACP